MSTAWHFTEGNHFKFGHNKQFIFTNGFNYSFEFGQVKRPPLSWREEAILAAKKIAASTSEPITILLSGGIDSEVVSRAFVAAGVKHSLLFCEYFTTKDGKKTIINEYDSNYALKYIKESGLSFKILSLDIPNFFSGPYHKYCEKYKLTLNNFSIYAWIVDETPGVVVMGCGDLCLYRLENTWSTFHREFPHWSLMFEDWRARNKNIVPRFFMYTPELMLSFLLDPLTKQFNKLSNPMRMLSMNTFKPLVYDSHWPDLKPRQKKHGLEDFHELRSLGDQLRVRYSDFDTPIAVPYESLIDGLQPKGALHGTYSFEKEIRPTNG
jgi:hypothetical protein